MSCHLFWRGMFFKHCNCFKILLLRHGVQQFAFKETPNISKKKKKILHTAKKVTHFKRKNADYCPPKKWEFHIGPSLGKENDSTLHFTVSQHAKHQFAVLRAFPLGKGSNKLLTSPTCKIRKIFLVVSDCLQAPFSGVQLCCSLCLPPATLWLPKNLLCWKRSKDP